MRWLNYHHLLYFRTIAMEGGISKAAKKLRLGQPTLSTQLRQFEEVLGKPLFERRHRSLVLTEAGRVALDYANEIFGLGDELMQVLTEERFRDRIHLTIGVLDSVPKVCVAALAREALRWSGCELSLLEGKGDELFRDMFAHHVDLVLTNHTPSYGGPERAYAKPIARFPVSVFGAPSFAPLAKGFPASLEGQPFILPTFHSKLRHDLDHTFKALGLSVSSVVETQDTSVQKILAIDGAGLVAIPDFAGMELVKERKLVRVGPLSGVNEEIWLVAAARRIENPLASSLMKSFRFETPFGPIKGSKT